MSGFRRALIRVVRFFVVRPAALLGLGALVLAGVAAVLFVPALLLPQGSGLPTLSLPRPGGEPVATEEYLRGNREYNATLMWASLSDEARQRLLANGGSEENLQRQLQVARERGTRLEEVSYIGGKELPDGTSMQFYLVGVKQPTRNDLEYIPYLFTLDRGGKIAKVQ